MNQASDQSEVPATAHKTRRFRVMPVLVMLALLGGVLLAGGWLWLRYQGLRPGPLTHTTAVVIAPGSGLRQIAQQLAGAGVVRSADIAVLWARLNHMDRDLKAGEYAFSPAMPLSQALAVMREGAVVVHSLSVPEGLTSAEIVDRLQTETLLDGAVGQIPAEGTLLPETYHFERGETRDAVLTRMRVAMSGVLDELWAGRAEGLPLQSPEQALILASIVEKETGIATERARVAGVFINRLKRGMKLQSDPTVAYAITGGARPLGRLLTRADWKVDSPYNTYKVAGLPPGPICNPGRAAIAAVLHPEAHKFLFFVANGQGGHDFAESYAQHQHNISKARRR